ncbi:hypothetical protein RCC89_11495 [Cytophagaceae bacterium ABcell3]|nr:hypothetical protein RCC89_11495 [Cytophagaceae bacterium ABcell3]
MKSRSILYLVVGILLAFSFVLIVDQMGMSKSSGEVSHRQNSSVMQVNGVWIYTKDKPWFSQYTIGTIDKNDLPNNADLQSGSLHGQKIFNKQLEELISQTRLQLGNKNFNAIVIDENLSFCKVMDFTEKN